MQRVNQNIKIIFEVANARIELPDIDCHEHWKVYWHMEIHLELVYSISSNEHLDTQWQQLRVHDVVVCQNNYKRKLIEACPTNWNRANSTTKNGYEQVLSPCPQKHLLFHSLQMICQIQWRIFTLHFLNLPPTFTPSHAFKKLKTDVYIIHIIPTTDNTRLQISLPNS